VVNYDFTMTSLSFDEMQRKMCGKRIEKKKKKCGKRGIIQRREKREERRENKWNNLICLPK